jgi:hypothetical protein
MSVPALGVDIGGVIMDRVNDRTDTSFFKDNYLNTTTTRNVVEVLRKLAMEKFKHRIYLVSKCGKETEKKTLHWLEYHNFYTRTGIGKNNVYFCRHRSDKAQICKELGINTFVDDRLEVLGYISEDCKKYLFNPDPEEVKKHQIHLPGVVLVQNWDEIKMYELI